MPYIQLQTNCTLTPEQKTAVFQMLNDTISIIPGKSAQVTMIQLVDGCAMQMSSNSEPCVFFEIRMFRNSPDEAKALYVQTVTEKLSQLLGVNPTRIYMNLTEHQSWGSGGNYRA